MTFSQALDLMQIELECINRANQCNRDCYNCDLVQEDSDLIAAYGVVIDLLKEKING